MLLIFHGQKSNLDQRIQIYCCVLCINYRYKSLGLLVRVFLYMESIVVLSLKMILDQSMEAIRTNKTQEIQYITCATN